MSKKIIKETRESLDENKVHNTDRKNSYNALKASIRLFNDNSKLSNDEKEKQNAAKKLT